ncbi:hypothetical protein Adt_36281 [Abeliophyllum distichum]|uniref:Uncharacterized protein n=1 Tax=Abeliophyllum distichum TaxID=126358 RepID=A0ABD1QH67_9LAMI
MPREEKSFSLSAAKPNFKFSIQAMRHLGQKHALIKVVKTEKMNNRKRRLTRVRIVVLTEYPFSSNSLTSKDAMKPVPPTTQAVFDMDATNFTYSQEKMKVLA